MKFQLLGKEIEISDGRKNYMKVLSHFSEMAENATNAFVKDYENTFALTFFSSSYAEKLSNKYTDTYFRKFMMTYATETRKYLSGFGVYELTAQDIYDAITEKNCGVTRLQDTFEEEIITLVANAPDDATDSDFVPRIKSKFDRGIFSCALSNDIYAMCDYALVYLGEKGYSDIQYIYKEDAQRARAYYENLKSTVLTDEQRFNIMCSIPITLSPEEFSAEFNRRLPNEIPYEEQKGLAYALIDLDPREEDYYRLIFKNFPEAKFEIAEIAKYLSIDISDLIEDSVSEVFDTKKIKTEEEALNMQQELQVYLDRFGLKSSPVKTELEKLIYDFDVRARTYAGVLYDTRDLRAKAERDDQHLYELCGDWENRPKNECVQLIAKITAEVYLEGIKEQYIRKLQSRIVAIEKAELEALLQGLAAKTEPECETLKQDVEAYDADETTKKPFFDRIQKRITEIWDAEDFARFSELFKQTPVGNSAIVGQNCAVVQKTGRTGTKELFLKAFYLLNENEVAAAAKYAIAKEKGAIASLLNMGKKESYDLLTLQGRVMHPAIEAAMQEQKTAKEGGLFGGFGKRKGSFGFGKTSAPAKFCPKCGNSVAQGANFCSSCGSKIG